MKAVTWIKVAIKPDEIQCTPNIMVEVNKCCANVDEKAADLHEEIRRELTHSGNENVGKKQQNRHLSQIQ